ncbi:MAG: hypothetical protein M3179_09375 [Actinomycetota bacterium]|nr:hypothetical protein [Actinomycetota bacterium]
MRERPLSRLRTPVWAFAAFAALLVALSASPATSAAGAPAVDAEPPPPTCRNEPLGPGWTDLVNCSAAPVDAVRAVLDGTDARRRGLIHPHDRFLANRQWLVWIDSTRSPGTMRGLWALTPAGQFAGIPDPAVGGAHKSVIAVGAGFGRPTSNPVRGYRGTHVEIWRTPGTWYYTYPMGPPAARDLLPTEAGRSVSRYVSPLVDARNGSPTVEGLNGVRASMNWMVSYTLEPDRFLVETEVTTSSDVDFTGDLGGLLLLTNPACSLPGNYGDCGNLGALSARSLHRLDTPVVDDLLWNRQITSHSDQFHELRNSPAAWVLAADEPAHNLVVTPATSSTDPQGQPYTPKTAYHYNSRPFDLGGLNGFGSFDVVMEAPAGGRIAIGPTRGALRFGATLTHRAAVAEATAALIRRAQGEAFSWLSSRWGRLPW